MKKIVVLVSGGGTNLGALIKAEQNGEINNGKIGLVISSKADAYALQRAKDNGIPTEVVDRKSLGYSEFQQKIAKALRRSGADVIVLAGFMYILNEEICKQYTNRIINVHPALIPSFCGEGYYGLRVHQAALDYGVKLTGATVHFVNEVADGGPIILQKSVPVKNGDTAEGLQKRVMEQAEWVILPKAVSLLCEDKIKIVNGKTIVEELEHESESG